MLNLLNEASNSRFVTRKWNIANGHSNTIMMKKTKLSIEALKSNLYDYIDATFYLLVKGDITILGDNGAEVAFTNFAPV